VSGQDRALSLLEGQNRQLNEAQRLSGVGSWSWDPAISRAEWSPQMYRIFDRDPILGPPAGDALGAHLHGEDQESVVAAFAESMGTHLDFELDYRIVVGAGQIRCLHMIAARHADGRYVGTTQDVTVADEARAVLVVAERTNHTLALIVTESDDAVIAKTLPDGVITEWNRSAQRIYGYAPIEIIGQPISLLVPAERRGEEHALMREVLADRAVPQYETTRVRKDGSVVEVSITVSPIHDTDRQIVGASVISRDITDRKRLERALREAEERFRGAFEEAPIGIGLVDLDGNWLRVNRKLCEIVGYSEPELLGRTFLDITHPADKGSELESARRVLDGEIPAYQLEKRYVTKNGAVVWINVSVSLVRDSDDRPLHFIRQIQDITERKRLESALREVEERFRGAFDLAPIGIALVALDGRWEKVNDSLCSILGHPRERLEGIREESLTHPDDIGADLQAISEMRTGKRSSYSVEKRYLHASGHPVYCSLQMTVIPDENGQPRSLLAQIQDITDQRRHDEQLEYLADHDALTGLRNRRAFARELASHAGLAARYGEAGTILMIDLDQFKFVNDTLGHQAGDELIVRVAHILAERLRDTDVLARLGGDEFAVLLPKTDPTAAKLVAESILERLRTESIPIGGTPRKISASIGIASFADAPGLTGEDVLINADLAMYDAKEDGRNNYSMFSTDQHRQARMKGRITWAHRINTALENDGFALLGQPIIDLGTGRPTQYELLLRMKDQHGDLIPPSTFLYIAERLDLIRDIDTWVVTKGIRMLSELDPLQKISLEINLSGRSLGDQKLLEHIEHELRAASIAPERVIFEITETAALTSVAKARAFGEHLSEIGCRFALDDFGAGFGSFYYLKHLVFDYVKIDGEFVRDCRSNNTDKLVIKAIVDIARGMGKQTIAEFVGDDETVQLLNGLGVDYGQGYHLGMPAPLATWEPSEILVPADATNQQSEGGFERPVSERRADRP
jgi:diguanylate cyclase (GGDEF)-like protein/PAS domain S-box-containing protein